MSDDKTLIINLCRNELHYFEFVKPIVDIVEKNLLKYEVVNIAHLSMEHLKSSSKIIICGTSLRDFDYENKDFSWIKSYNKPILGICAGFQMICKIYGGKTKRKIGIGLKYIRLKKDFLGFKGKIQVYCLHNNIIVSGNDFHKKFITYGGSGYIQAIKMESKQIYATLFHPEVRNKKIIENFLYI